MKMRNAGKVRKQFILDPIKIQTVKKITKAKTATQAVDRALDSVIANSRIEKMLLSVKGKGNIQDTYGRLSG